MMSKKSPQLRFEGFTDDWEERKLSSGLREYTDRVIVEDDKEYYQISVRNNFGGITLRGSKMGNKIGRKRQAKINLTKYPQTLIFTRQTVEQGGIGWVDKYCDGAIVTENMPTISLDTSVFSKYFLTNLFQTRIFYKNAILDNIEGGSAQIAIHESKFLSSTLLFPNLDEQEKIGQFFKQLDDTIDLHQRKLDLLKEQKKGYLQKMFPKNGAKVPELRFAGFADDWEERKFESLLDKNEGVRRGPFGSALKKDLFVKESPYVVYEQQNAIYDHYETRYNISKEKFEELHKFELIADDFIMSGAGTIGRIAKVPKGIKKGVFNQALIRFRINKELTDSEYFLQFIRADFMQRKLTGANPGSAITNLVPMSDVKKWEIKVPIKEEQKKIGSFFKQLDNTIALHQRKLDLLKEQKKGFLQKMFV
ncbi:TPA: restriction endonuclease subunit S [Streptococcus suis]